jgi:hypothetical protein
MRAVTGSGGRLHFGMVAGIKSERWPTSDRNPWPDCVGIRIERFGLITDYLAEAFHHQLKHSNRYEEVSKRVKLGSNVEGRDEKGIKKTLCALLKMVWAPPRR